MKREEAIKDLDIIRFNPHWDEFVNEEYWKELMEMAITALQNQPVWIPVSERLPEDCVPVNVTWINRNPEPYYEDIKDVPFVDTAVYCNGKWYWWSSVCVDYLKEYGERYNIDLVDEDIDIVSWMPLPEPYRESEPHNQTKADEIRSMTDEELAAFIINFDNRFGEEYEGEQSCLSWLQKESEETK